LALHHGSQFAVIRGLTAGFARYPVTESYLND